MSLPTIVGDGNKSKTISTHNQAIRALGTFDIRYFPYSIKIAVQLQEVSSYITKYRKTMKV
jgi:hypothetical protein